MIFFSSMILFKSAALLALLIPNIVLPPPKDRNRYSPAEEGSYEVIVTLIVRKINVLAYRQYGAGAADFPQPVLPEPKKGIPVLLGLAQLRKSQFWKVGEWAAGRVTNLTFW